MAINRRAHVSWDLGSHTIRHVQRTVLFESQDSTCWFPVKFKGYNFLEQQKVKRWVSEPYSRLAAWKMPRRARSTIYPTKFRSQERIFQSSDVLQKCNSLCALQLCKISQDLKMSSWSLFLPLRRRLGASRCEAWFLKFRLKVHFRPV